MSRAQKRVEVVTAQQTHVADLAPKMKAGDIDECQASHGVGPEEALSISLGNSREAFSVMVDGRVEMMFGICHEDNSTGLVWMLSSEAVFDLVTRKRFLRESRRYMKRFHRLYEVIYNCVDERNFRSIMWLKRIGFKLIDYIPEYGVSGMPFVRVESRG